MIANVLGVVVASALLISYGRMWSNVTRPARSAVTRRRMRRASGSSRYTRSGRVVHDPPTAIDLEFWAITGGPGERS